MTTTKYEEGRAAALRRLQRLFNKCGDISPDVEYFVLREEAAYWRRLLLSHVDVDLPSLPALAYSRGGLDVVETLWAAHATCDTAGTRGLAAMEHRRPRLPSTSTAAS